MNRRTSIRTLMFISAGAAILPACLQEPEIFSLSLKNIKINTEDGNVLAGVSEAIIPATDTPGAKEVGAHLFAIMMVDECYPADDQDKFVKGIKAFKELVDKKYGKSFANITAAEKNDLITAIQSKKDIPENVDFFYNTMKRYTIQAYMTSEYFLTKVQVYKLVPGEFYGCVPVKKAS